MFFEWPDNQPATLLCIDKFVEARDTVTIRLAEPNRSLTFRFKAGQFINLGVQINGQTEFRAYSICSVSGDNYLQLTIKRVESGRVSNFIVDSLSVGDTVQALPPIGEFNCIDHPPRSDNNQHKALLISAGCGITPVIAMAKHWLLSDQQVDIEFLHIARSPKETIYLQLLERFQTEYDNFHLKLLLKHAGHTSYPQGRLDKHWLQQLVPNLQQRTVYLCGPNQFMADVRHYLSELNFDMRFFFQESFTPSETYQNSVSDEHAVISVPAFGKSIDSNKGQVLADVLEEAGLPLVIACRSGICGSCRCKVQDGSVSSTSQQTLTAEQIEQGYVLACSSVIESDLTVDIG